MPQANHFNAYIEDTARRWWQRCVICRRRWVVGRFHEVYDLGVACNGQCKDTCCHGWAYACSPCTVKVASGCTDRVRYSRDELRQLTLCEVLAMFDPEHVLNEPVASSYYKRIAAYCESINADQQHDGY